MNKAERLISSKNKTMNFKNLNHEKLILLRKFNNGSYVKEYETIFYIIINFRTYLASSTI